MPLPLAARPDGTGTPPPDQDIPDRTPPARAHYRNRVRKTCVVCCGPFLVATTCQRGYQTCSPECSSALRSRSQQARCARTTPAAEARPPRNARTPGARAPRGSLPNPGSRPDVLLVGRAAAVVLCVSCGGQRGRWARCELPPPELCWRCLWHRNAGLDPRKPLV